MPRTTTQWSRFRKRSRFREALTLSPHHPPSSFLSFLSLSLYFVYFIIFCLVRRCEVGLDAARTYCNYMVRDAVPCFEDQSCPAGNPEGMDEWMNRQTRQGPGRLPRTAKDCGPGRLPSSGQATISPTAFHPSSPSLHSAVLFAHRGHAAGRRLGHRPGASGPGEGTKPGRSRGRSSGRPPSSSASGAATCATHRRRRC